MRRVAMPLLGTCCALVLGLVCYRAVLFRGEQFAFRDVAHFYYPLYLRVQQEWQAGRWPLWDPWQNGGQPLLGNPIAAVFYPGKLIYSLLPYEWAARFYVIAHTALAFAGARSLARTLGISETGAVLSGLSYAFGAPVLFQYSNPIFLVGAAWLPWGLRGVDRLLRQGRPRGLAELALILAIEVLGGDPQAAYLTILCGAGYGLFLMRPGRGWLAGLGERWSFPVVVLVLATSWIVVSLLLVYKRISISGWVGPIWLPALPAWGAIGVWLIMRRKLAGGGGSLMSLAIAGALAVAMAAIQIVPTAEFSSLSNRMGENSALAVDRFSLEPYRLVELVWPGFFGRMLPEGRSWLQAVPPVGGHEVWNPSVYVSGFILLLVLGTARSERSSPWQSWMTAIAIVSLLASFGKYGGPLWWARCFPGLESALGPHDPRLLAPRNDALLGDGAGSLYSLFSAAFPGFGLFRYSSKLLTFTSLAMSILAGSGWDDLTGGRAERLAPLGWKLLTASMVALALALVLQGPAVAFLSGRIPYDSLTGPPDAGGAWVETQRALLHGVLIFAASLGLATWGFRHPQRGGAMAVVLLALDLGFANAWLIWTAPQASYDRVPEVVRRIEAAERADPSPVPFRVHRMPLWRPERFLRQTSPARFGELLDWERGTLQGLHALPLGIELCVSVGTLEQDEYLSFYRPMILPARGEMVRALRVSPDHPIYYLPRRSFDLWGARYFILPIRPQGWGSPERGYASLVSDTEPIYPDPARLGGVADQKRWTVNEDWQLLRNKKAFPRAWVVHSVRVVPPATDPDSRVRLIREMAYQDDPLWSDPRRRVFDPRSMAWVETDERNLLGGDPGDAAIDPEESVEVTDYSPQRVVVKAKLERPGLVVLADTYYPGWRLTVDGKPSSILRTNRLMRGAVIAAGEHELVYVYDPRSFQVGLAVTLVGCTAWMVILLQRSRRNRDEVDPYAADRRAEDWKDPCPEIVPPGVESGTRDVSGPRGGLAVHGPGMNRGNE